MSRPASIGTGTWNPDHRKAVFTTLDGYRILHTVRLYNGGEYIWHQSRLVMHRVMNTIGLMKGCALEGCGKNEFGKDQCPFPAAQAEGRPVPWCMTLIKPGDVISAIEWYYRGETQMPRTLGRVHAVFDRIREAHCPYQGDPKWIERCKNLPSPRNLYAAFVSTLDERIGLLMKSVDDLGLREKTIIVYQSDNGHSTEERAFFGGGSAGPYRGAKFSLFEGGIRLPGLISWPGHLPKGEKRGQMVHACDWMPTLGELAGIPLLNRDIDGKSIVPVIRSAIAPSPHDVLHWLVSDGPKKPPQWAVRQGDWKLIGHVLDSSGGKLDTADKELFLSNPALDPSEKTNLASQHPELARSLLKLHNDWFAAQKPAPAAQTFKDAKGNEKQGISYHMDKSSCVHMSP